MNVVITGSASGIGLACVKKFIDEGHVVHGIDVSSTPVRSSRFIGHICDVSESSMLPEIDDVDILINNAGTQLGSNGDMNNNFWGVKNCTEKYGLHENIKSILNQASVSAHTGAEFPEYCASKGAVLTYTKWTANEVSKYGATCNSLSCGGVLTELNRLVTDDKDCWNEIIKYTPLKKWATPEEIADWVYFFTVINKSCTGQDLIIDNGETSQTHFVWPE